MLQKLKANPSEYLGLKFRELRKSIQWKFIRSEYEDYLKSLSDQLKENLKRFWSFLFNQSQVCERLPDVSIYKGTSDCERPLLVWCVARFCMFPLYGDVICCKLLLFSLKSAC